MKFTPELVAEIQRLDQEDKRRRMPLVLRTVLLPQDLDETLNETSAQTGLSKSAIIRHYCRMLIARHDLRKQLQLVEAGWVGGTIPRQRSA